MHVDQHVAQVGVVAAAQVVLDHGGFRAAAQFDEVAHVAGGIAVARRGADEHQVQRLGQAGVLGHAQDRAVMGERGIEPGEDFVGAGVAALHEIGSARVRIGQRLFQGEQRGGRRQR